MQKRALTRIAERVDKCSITAINRTIRQKPSSTDNTTFDRKQMCSLNSGCELMSGDKVRESAVQLTTVDEGAERRKM
jgi:hypothetical protein